MIKIIKDTKFQLVVQILIPPSLYQNIQRYVH